MRKYKSVIPIIKQQKQRMLGRSPLLDLDTFGDGSFDSGYLPTVPGQFCADLSNLAHNSW